MTAIDTNKIQQLAQQVAVQHAEYKEAIASERAAEVQVLEQVIALVKPALRALCGRIVATYDVSHHADVNYGGGVCKTTSREERGFCIAGDARAYEDTPQANSGGYEGQGLWLLADGTLAEIAWSGNWSRWQGSSWGYASVLHPVTFSAREWKLNECLESIESALAKQLAGNKPAVTEAALARATKLRAAVVLLSR